MKKIIIVDTNFLIKNLGKIKDIVNELKEKDVDILVPELVKEEFINNQLRKLEDTYKELENLQKSHTVLKLKYTEKENARNEVEEAYNLLFEETFGDNIIKYKKEGMLDRVLARNRYKLPPFNSDPKSSDKGFKDTIILLSILDYFNEIKEDDVIFYFVTMDGGFSKNKKELESEILESTGKKITIIESNEKSKILKELDIVEETEEIKEENENVFSQPDVNIDEIRKRINELMDVFTWNVSYDYFGNPQEERRFDVVSEITNEETEKFLNNIDNVIESNIFRKDISIELFFDITDLVFSNFSIDVDTVKEISELYKKIKNTKYKEPFLNYISQRINENKVNTTGFTVEAVDGDLPF